MGWHVNSNGAHKRCVWCSEPVLPDEQAPISAPIHIECSIRSMVGSVAHVEGTCGCYVPGSKETDPPGISLREAAKLAAAAFARRRREALE